MSWLFGKRDEHIAARLAKPTDRAALSALLADTWRRQGLLALEDQAALLRSGLSTIAFTGDRAVGFLGLSPRAPAGTPPESWADVSLAAIATNHSAGRVIERLLESGLPPVRAAGVTGLVCLATEGWLRDGLAGAGFVQVDQVISYAYNHSRGLPSQIPVVQLRVAGTVDADPVLAVNAAAFEPFWRYDDSTVLSWLLTADHAVLAESAGQPVGFALTTWNRDADYAYLIRLATLPAFRGLGIGQQLVVDALRYAQDAGAPGLALNTQASNTVSRRLYESMGFQPTGQTLAVMVYLT